MARYQVILAYDGTDYRGYQRQRGAPGRTIQGAFEQALRKIGWAGKSVLSAGRTDSGVHARGQVIAFDMDWSHQIKDLHAALNTYLPHSIAVRAVRQVKDDFHPRFDALYRRYRYHIFCDRRRDPLRERYAWRVWPEVELSVLRQQAMFLVGEHDFSAFGTPHNAGGSTVREVFKADWQGDENGFFFDVAATGFLYHMVRRMVFVQVGIAQGHLESDLVLRRLDDKGAGGSIIQGLAPPHGLFLEEVRYLPEAVELPSNAAVSFPRSK